MDGNARHLHRERYQFCVRMFPCDHLVHAGATSDGAAGASEADAGHDVSGTEFWDLAGRLGYRGSFRVEGYLNGGRSSI